MTASLPVVILRPEPGASATAALAAGIGLTWLKVPLFDLRATAWTAPDPGDYDALLLTSANAVRLAGDQLGLFAALPCHLVGSATAAAAQRAGLNVKAVGNNGVQTVVDGMAAQGFRRPLWLCGEHRTPVDHGAHRIAEIAVYAAVPVEQPPDWPAATAQPAIVLLHSARAAVRVAELAGLTRNHLIIVSISPKVAALAGDGWAHSVIAATPDDRAMLARAVNLCQTQFHQSS